MSRARTRAQAASRVAGVALAAALALAQIVSTDSPAAAQGGGRDLAELALGWARGDFRAPIVCEIDGEARQALRRIRIAEGSRRSARASSRILFFDLEAPPDTRCVDMSGDDEPNVIGQLVIHFEGRRRPDTAGYDFQAALRREGGFRFPVQVGALRVGPPGGTLEEHDLADGTVHIRRVPPGSDAARRLAEFGPRRKLRLEVEAEDGLRLAFDLVQFGE